MLEVIETRRSTRKFKAEPVAQELLQEVVEAGRYAPSGGNSQSTHFLVVTKPEVLEKLAELAKEAFAAMELYDGMYASLRTSVTLSRKGSYCFHYHTPCLIITANDKDYGNNIADCACALENMMLQANALDLGSCWINQLRWLNEDPKLLEYLRSLGMRENERVYGALALGYAATEDGLPIRKALPRTGNPVTVID